MWYNNLKEGVMRIEKKHFVVAALGATVALLLSFIFSRKLFISGAEKEPEIIDV
jgi:uncharacterized protein YacL